MIKVSLFPMAPSVSSRAALLVSFVSKDTAHFPIVQVALSTKLFFLRSAGALQLCIFPLQIFPRAFLFVFPLSTTSQGVANVGGGSAILWSSSLAESPQVPLLTWGDLINALNHPLLIFAGPSWQG